MNTALHNSCIIYLREKVPIYIVILPFLTCPKKRRYQLSVGRLLVVEQKDGCDSDLTMYMGMGRETPETCGTILKSNGE